MVQKTFGIYNDDETADKLFIELGADHIACWTINDENAFSSFEFFQADNETRTHMAEIFRDTKLFSKLLGKNYSDVKVILDNECCLTVPDQHYNKDQQKQLLTMAFGDDHIPDLLSNDNGVGFLFGAHRNYNDWLRKELPNAAITHKYHFLDTIRPSVQGKPLLWLTCYPGHCIVQLMIDDQLQLMQRYTYHTPEDVVYYVLNICKQQKVDLNDLEVRVQGLISDGSALYSELYKYLPEMHLFTHEGVRFASDAFSGYPAHYFSSFVNRVA